MKTGTVRRSPAPVARAGVVAHLLDTALRRLSFDGVPIRAVELDSWCYQHEVPRPIAEIGYPEEVPPSGLMTWEPRADAFDPPSAGPSTRSSSSPSGSAAHRW